MNLRTGYLHIGLAILCFLLCSMESLAQPANDDCVNATSVTPNSATCTAGTTVNSNNTFNGGAFGCLSGNNNDDVWFTFVADETFADITVTSGTLGGDAEVLFMYPDDNANPCASGTFEDQCGASPLTALGFGPLTIGNTYLFTISSSGADGTFDVCVDTYTPPPNDNCSGAQPLIPGDPCTAGTTINSTDFWAGDPDCTTSDANGNNNDVWYSFNSGTGETATISVEGVTTGVNSISIGGNIEILLVLPDFPLNPCAAGYTIATGSLCGPQPYTAVTNVLPNTVYYFTVASSVADGDFEVCVETFPPPLNDDCSGTVALTPGDCSIPSSFTSGTTLYSTDFWAGDPDCTTSDANGNNNDVWYSFTPGAGVNLGSIYVTENNDNSTPITGDIEMILVTSTGGCSGPFSLETTFLCGPAPFTGEAIIQPGTTYYFTIASSGDDGDFNVCVETVLLQADIEANCNDAQAICNVDPNDGLPEVDQGTFIGVGTGTTEDISTNSCFGADEQQSKWYKFTSRTTDDFSLHIDPNNNNDDIDFALYDVTTNPEFCVADVSNFDAPLVCNWSYCPGSTGIIQSTDPLGEGFDTDPVYYDVYFAPPNQAFDCSQNQQWETGTFQLEACHTYALLVDNYSVNTNGFKIEFSGDATIGYVEPPFTVEYSSETTVVTAENNVILSCPNVTVTVTDSDFKTCEAADANFTYTLDFGDGSAPVSGFDPTVPYTYTYNGLPIDPGAESGDVTYTPTVTLTSTDPGGCLKSTDFSLNLACVLPIELLNFDAIAMEKTVELNWTTGSEINNDFFTLERSRNNQDFEIIGLVTGSGNSSAALEYSFTDRFPIEGLSYYRLRQTDYDGTTEVFSPVAVYFNTGDFDMSLYTISEGQYILNLTAQDESFSNLAVFDLLGNEVYRTEVQVQIGSNSFELDLSKLNHGLYSLRLLTKTQQEFVSFLR